MCPAMILVNFRCSHIDTQDYPSYTWSWQAAVLIPLILSEVFNALMWSASEGTTPEVMFLPRPPEGDEASYSTKPVLFVWDKLSSMFFV